MEGYNVAQKMRCWHLNSDVDSPNSDICLKHVFLPIVGYGVTAVRPPKIQPNPSPLNFTDVYRQSAVAAFVANFKCHSDPLFAERYRGKGVQVSVITLNYKHPITFEFSREKPTALCPHICKYVAEVLESARGVFLGVSCLNQMSSQWKKKMTRPSKDTKAGDQKRTLLNPGWVAGHQHEIPTPLESDHSRFE